MPDSRKQLVLRIINGLGGRLVRQKRHHKYQFPDGQVLTLPSTPSDSRAWHNVLAQVRRMFGLDRQGKRKSSYRECRYLDPAYLPPERNSEFGKASEYAAAPHQDSTQPEEPSHVEGATHPPEDHLQRMVQTLKQAEQLEMDCKYEDAQQQLLALIGVSDLPTKIEEDALLQLGRVYAALDEPEAEGFLRKCMELQIYRLGRGQHLLPVVTALAEFYAASGDYDSFFKLGSDNADLDMELEPAERLQGIFPRALVEFSNGRHVESLKRLRCLSHTKGNTPISVGLDAYRYCLLGMNYSAIYELFLAELAFDCALRCCDASRSECEDVRPRILMYQGIAYRRDGRYTDALNAYTETVKLLRRQQRTDSIFFADVMASIGVVHRHLGDLERAEECVETAADIYKVQGSLETPEYATLLNNFGVLRTAQEKYEEAEAFLIQARDLFELKSSGDVRSRVTLHLHLGNLYDAK